MSRSTLSKVRWSRRATVLLAATAAVLAALLVVAAGVSFDPTTAQAQGTSASWQLQAGTNRSGTFSDAEGLSQGRVEVIETKTLDPSGNEIIRKTPGKRTIPPIVLRRPLSANQSMAEWHQMLVDGSVELARTNGSILRLSGTGQTVVKFNFTNGWPADYRVVMRSGVLVEEVELAVEDLDRVTP